MKLVKGGNRPGRGEKCWRIRKLEATGQYMVD